MMPEGFQIIGGTLPDTCLLDAMLEDSAQAGRGAIAACASEPPCAPHDVRGDGLPVTLVTSMQLGGAELVTVDLAISLEALGFDVVVVNPVAPAEEGSVLSRRLSSAGIAYQERPDVPAGTAATIWWGNLLRDYIERGGHVPGSIHVLHSSGRPTADMTRDNLAALHISQSALVGVSSSATKLAGEVAGLPCRTVWNGVFAPQNHSSRARGSTFTVGFLGRYAPEKNLAALVAAMCDLPSSVRLRMYGHGPLRGDLLRLAIDLRIEDRIDVGGCLPDIGAALGEFDCLALPSTFEGFPTVIPPAMLAGVPVVATPLGDTPLVCRHGERGILCGPAPKSIAAAVEGLMDGDQVGIASRARAFARQHLTAEAMGRHYGRMIQEVAA